MEIGLSLAHYIVVTFCEIPEVCNRNANTNRITIYIAFDNHKNSYADNIYGKPRRNCFSSVWRCSNMHPWALYGVSPDCKTKQN